jgi:hypothetical protein
VTGTIEAPPIEPPVRTDPAAAPSRPARGRSRLRRNWLFALFLLGGVALRVCALGAYQPGLLYIDSYRYLDNLTLNPAALDPIGYDLLLKFLFLPLGGLRLVVLTQNLLGVVMALAVYALALRHGARRWLAAIAAAPVLLDAYQVQIEQNIMSDVWQEAAAIAILWLLISRGRPTPARAGWAGVLLGATIALRTIAFTFALPAVLFLIVAGGAWRTRDGWRRIGARLGVFLLGLGFVVFCYAGYFHKETGEWGLTGSSSGVLYGRTAEVVDCATLKVPDDLRQLCPTESLNQRLGVDYYAHLEFTPNWPGYLPPDATVQQLEHQFAYAVIEQQPLRVAQGILVDFGKGFAPGKSDTAATAQVPVTRWQFQTSYPIWLDPETAWRYTMTYSDQAPSVNVGLAGFLRAYQLHGGYTQGPVLAGFAVLGLIGGFGIGRRRSGIRSATLLTTTLGLVVLFGSAAFEFSWRYQLPGLVLLPLGGVLGLTALIGPLTRPDRTELRRSGRRRLAGFPDDVDWAAVEEFTTRYGQPSFAPVLVVIAAYNEAGGIGGVLDKLPRECCGLDLDVLVVTDGCADDTAAVAREHGAYVCEAPSNRGQGAALRLGYQLAGYGGARYVVTTDADGQYENSEMPLLLQPLIDDEADFVTGSRRLGVEDTDDRVRSAGVRFFATLASALTLRKITDTSFGFRAMRTELACSMRLRQPQYQASELLLGALANGARLLERPMTMRVRTAGKTKKGNNLVYGCNYAKVMTWTWLREYVLIRAGKVLRVVPREPHVDPKATPES